MLAIRRCARFTSSGTAITYLTEEDSETFYDLKKLLENSKLSSVPVDLAKHPATLQAKGVALDKHGKVQNLGF